MFLKLVVDFLPKTYILLEDWERQEDRTFRMVSTEFWKSPIALEEMNPENFLFTPN